MTDTTDDACTAHIVNEHSGGTHRCALEAGHHCPEFGADHAGPVDDNGVRYRWSDDAIGAVPHAASVVVPAADRAAVLTTADAYRFAADAVRATIAPADWPSDAISIWNTATNIAEHRLRRLAVESAVVDRVAAETPPADARDEEIALLRLTLNAVEEGRRELRADLARLRARLWTLTAMLEGLHTLLATSSRDWQTYRVDAWLWAVLVGWDCEQPVHDGTCTHGAMEETAALHGWDDDTVAKARRYRALVHVLTGPAVEAQPGKDTETPTPCGPTPSQCDAEAGEPCADHERQQAHAEGEHCFCGPECPDGCTCAVAGDAFVPAGHYADCPRAETPQPKEA